MYIFLAIMKKGVNNKKLSDIQWLDDGTFCFTKGSRPLWTSDAKNIMLAKNQDRRHGLHGAEVITKAVEQFINNELKKSGRKKTTKKLYVNLKSRKVALKSFEEQTLDQLINKFRKYAFSKVSNLLPGDSDYNRAIETVRQRMENIKKKLYLEFFSQGEMPQEIEVKKYIKYTLGLLKSSNSKNQSTRKKIIDNIINDVVIPRIKTCEDIREVDETISGVTDTTKIDIGFADAGLFKRFNKRVLDLDARIKRGIIAEEGLTQDIFNKLIGYRPRKK